jgi:hypothetical protein
LYRAAGVTRLALALAFVVRAVLPSGGHFPFSLAFLSLPLPTKRKSLLFDGGHVFDVTFDCPMQFFLRFSFG